MRGDYSYAEDMSWGSTRYVIYTAVSREHGSIVLYDLCNRGLGIREDLEHRLVGVSDEGSHCILLRPVGL